jgi:hypothetical protein
MAMPVRSRGKKHTLLLHALDHSFGEFVAASETDDHLIENDVIVNLNADLNGKQLWKVKAADYKLGYEHIFKTKIPA